MNATWEREDKWEFEGTNVVSHLSVTPSNLSNRVQIGECPPPRTCTPTWPRAQRSWRGKSDGSWEPWAPPLPTIPQRNTQRSTRCTPTLQVTTQLLLLFWCPNYMQSSFVEELKIQRSGFWERISSLAKSSGAVGHNPQIYHHYGKMASLCCVFRKNEMAPRPAWCFQMPGDRNREPGKGLRMLSSEIVRIEGREIESR